MKLLRGQLGIDSEMLLKHALLVALLLSLCLPNLMAFDAASMSESDKVILEAKGERDWKPTSDELKQGLAITQKFLRDPSGIEGGPEHVSFEKTEIKKILASKAGFRVQAWGVHRDGKKLLHLNFIPASPSTGEDEFANWKSGGIVVMDGGYSFWQADIDLASGTVYFFDSNGYALVIKPFGHMG